MEVKKCISPCVFDSSFFLMRIFLNRHSRLVMHVSLKKQGCSQPEPFPKPPPPFFSSVFHPSTGVYGPLRYLAQQLTYLAYPWCMFLFSPLQTSSGVSLGDCVVLQSSKIQTSYQVQRGWSEFMGKYGQPLERLCWVYLACVATRCIC